MRGLQNNRSLKHRMEYLEAQRQNFVARIYCYGWVRKSPRGGREQVIVSSQTTVSSQVLWCEFE